MLLRVFTRIRCNLREPLAAENQLKKHKKIKDSVEAYLEEGKMISSKQNLSDLKKALKELAGFKNGLTKIAEEEDLSYLWILFCQEH